MSGPASTDGVCPASFERELRLLFALLLLIAVAAIMFADDPINILLDAGWVYVGLLLVIVTRRRFPLTPLLYGLMFFHSLVLLSGGFWTYEAMPVGVWVQELLGTERNHYDRFGHFLQGFVPAILFRELFLRCSPVQRGGWLVYFVLTSCLAFSALFELMEWWATLLSGTSTNAFLGHQGDIWDAQWDMIWAIVGAVAAMLLLSRLHDRSLGRIFRSRLCQRRHAGQRDRRVDGFESRTCLVRCLR